MGDECLWRAHVRWREVALRGAGSSSGVTAGMGWEADVEVNTHHGHSRQCNHCSESGHSDNHQHNENHHSEDHHNESGRH